MTLSKFINMKILYIKLGNERQCYSEARETLVCDASASQTDSL